MNTTPEAIQPGQISTSSTDTEALDTATISPADLAPIDGFPLLLNVGSTGGSALAWANDRQSDIQSLLATHGAVLIRGLNVPGSSQFGKILSTLFGSELIQYIYRSTPRTGLRGNVYTATEYPASEVIPQHNENAYARDWPMRIGFLCMLPAETGGETPIGDSRLVYDMIPPSIRTRFEEKGIMYVRNYSDLDLPWSVVFQTDDRNDVEAYCDGHGLACEWLASGNLRTRQVNPATAVHPDSGEKLWFNQAHLFHVSSLGAEVAEALASSLGEENLPRNAYYGDGEPIDLEALESIRAAYRQTRIRFSWERNDLLLLDNMRFNHGRESFTGTRRVLTGMAWPNRTT
jgi:alpha-ketoglutarate-dependent taurine dioxygenase